MSSQEGDTPLVDPGEPVPPGRQSLDPTVLAELRTALGDDEFVFDLVQTFVAETPRQLATLTTAADAGDLETIVAAAHRLKGSALTFGAARIVSLCAVLEGSPAECGRILGRLHQEVDEVFDSLHRFLRDARAGCAPSQVAMPDRTSRRILVVDDDTLIREVARMALEAAGGWDVSTARNGAEAFEVALSDQPDVILMDVMMPVMDGPTACRALSEHGATSRIPIILLTAKQDLDEQRLVSTTVAGVMAKPFDPAGLPGAIEALLDTSGR